MNRNHDGTFSVNLVTSAAFAVTDPKLLTVDFAEIDKKQKERRAFLDKANPSPEQRAPAQDELKKLRNDHFNLKEAVKHTEIYANDMALNVESLEKRVEKALAEKKRQAEAGNLRAERYCENTIQRIESELVDAKKECERAKRQSANATHVFKTWEGHDRILELEAQIEQPVVTK